MRLVAMLSSVLAAGLLAFAEEPAKEVTVTGKLVCQHCDLGKEPCATVLLTKSADEKDLVYSFARNNLSAEINKLQGKKVEVTGTVQEREGKSPVMTATAVKEVS